MPNLIFLDIQLNDGYGFDILDDFEKHAPVIFTTAYNEYAIRGFKYNGLDYLLKPIDKKDLKQALNKYINNKIITDQNQQGISQLFSKTYKKRFMVKIGNQYNVLKVKDIAYFESEEGIIYLKTFQNKTYPVEYSLDQLSEILDPMNFFRVNRKILVSVNAVTSIHNYFNSRLALKLNPTQKENVIVARERTPGFKKWLNL